MSPSLGFEFPQGETGARGDNAKCDTTTATDDFEVKPLSSRPSPVQRHQHRIHFHVHRHNIRVIGLARFRSFRLGSKKDVLALNLNAGSKKWKVVEKEAGRPCTHRFCQSGGRVQYRTDPQSTFAEHAMKPHSGKQLVSLCVGQTQDCREQVRVLQQRS